MLLTLLRPPPRSLAQSLRGGTDMPGGHSRWPNAYMEFAQDHAFLRPTHRP